jgi:hypothetical protein
MIRISDLVCSSAKDGANIGIPQRQTSPKKRTPPRGRGSHTNLLIPNYSLSTDAKTACATLGPVALFDGGMWLDLKRKKSHGDLFPTLVSRCLC